MVTCDLIGRLGNQAFQLSAAYAHALRNGFEFRFPPSTYNQRIWPMYFRNKSFRPSYYRNKIEPYFEKRHCFDPIPPIDNIKLVGYFQSEKYFSDYRVEVLNMLGLDQVKSRDDPYEAAIHVRRGDYVTLSDKHPPITLNYINEAIDTLIYMGVYKFSVFSDDIKWCIGNIKFTHGGSSVITNFHKPGDAKADLIKMASFKHQIISNSTYSWWAAYANPYEEKHVIAPKIWFGEGNSNLETFDIIPEKWLKL